MILVAGAAWAATWVAGTDAPTVQGVIDLAATGDTITIPAGTWAECVDTGGRSLTIAGTGATLDGTGRCDSAFRVVGGEAVTVEGLAVTNVGGRAFDVEWSTLALDGVEVGGSGRGDGQGAAVWAYGAALTTTDCAFHDNVASEGGAVYLYAYTTWTDRGSAFERNAAGGSGGAVMAYYANTIDIDGARFVDDTAGYHGGGVATWDLTDLTITGSTFTGDSAPTTGGGAVFFYPTDTAYGRLELTGNTFTENRATDGGAVWIGWANDATVADDTFTGNVATVTGGGVLVYVAGTVRVDHDLFCGNRAVAGGGLSVQWTTTDVWTRNTFAENHAAEGGGAHRYASYAGTVLQNTFVGNEATNVGGAYRVAWAYADFRNNLVVDTPAGTGIYTDEATSYAQTPVRYDGWALNAVADGAGYFFVEDGLDGNVVAGDPGFVTWTRDGDCTDDDLRLASGSPFRDAGDPAILDLDGSRSDPGAWGGPDQPVVDLDGDGAATDTDCDDTNAEVGPDGVEVCDGVDDDCDGTVDGPDAADAATWYTDADGDGYGDPARAERGCVAPAGTVATADDCDDADRWVHPGASDYPGDGVDADCSGADNTQVVPDPPVREAPDTDGGCGCAASPPTAPAAFVPLLALAARRRRRTT